MSTKRTASVIDLDKDSGKEILACTVASIDKNAIIRIWSHFLSSIKQTISEIESIFKHDS